MSKAATDLISTLGNSCSNTRLSKSKPPKKENLYQRVESFKKKLFKVKIVPLNDKNITQENQDQVDNSKCECPTVTLATEASKSDCHVVTNTEPKLNIHQDFNENVLTKGLSFSNSTKWSRSKLDLHSVDSNSEICRNVAIIKEKSIGETSVKSISISRLSSSRKSRISDTSLSSGNSTGNLSELSIRSSRKSIRSSYINQEFNENSIANMDLKVEFSPRSTRSRSFKHCKKKLAKSNILNSNTLYAESICDEINHGRGSISAMIRECYDERVGLDSKENLFMLFAPRVGKTHETDKNSKRVNTSKQLDTQLCIVMSEVIKRFDDIDVRMDLNIKNAELAKDKLLTAKTFFKEILTSEDWSCKYSNLIVLGGVQIHVSGLSADYFEPLFFEIYPLGTKNRTKRSTIDLMDNFYYDYYCI